MISTYLKVAVRSFAANKLYSFINVFALSVAMTCGIVAYVNFDFARSYDRFHEHYDDLYVFRSVTAVDRGQNHLGITPLPLGPTLKKDFPSINKMSRIVFAWNPLQVGDKVLNEATYYVDADFLDMFTFPIVAGEKNVLGDKSKIVLTRKTANRYFGEENPIGKVMTLQSGGKQSGEFLVGAVIEDIPSNSSLQFDVLLPYISLPDVNRADVDWNEWSHETIVQIDDPAVVQKVKEKLDEYVERQNAVNPELPISLIYMEGMPEVASNSRSLSNDILKEGMHPAAVLGPTVTSILLLLTACINFMNTSLAFYAGRLKEVGIRKVLGSVRSQLVVQFIGENLILCAFSLIVAVGLAEIFVPAYGNLWPEWDLTLSYADNWGLFAFLAILLVMMSVLSGAYPSLYVSRFSPVTILTGRQRLGGKNWLIQSILTFQFALSALTVLAGIVFTDNADFLQKLDLGFESRQTIAVPMQGTNSFEALRNAALQNPAVLRVEGTRHLIGYSQSTLTARSGDLERRVATFKCGIDYLSVINLKLVQGREFDRRLTTDLDDAVIVTRKFAKEFQWDQPIGQRVMLDSVQRTVIGVVDDFYNRGVWRPLQPGAFLLADSKEFRYLVVRAEFANLSEVNTFLADAWHRIAPNLPYEGFYGSELVANAVTVSSTIRLVFLYVSGVAIAIAAMGLFALSSLIIVKRTREIGIRKVLGAPVFHIIKLLNRQIAIVLVLSGILATLGGYFTIGIFLDSLFAYHVELQPWHCFMAAGVVFFIGLVTVSSQVFRVATSNPAESLKYE